jgi:hypothetical protein
MPEIIINGRKFEIVEPGAAAAPKTIEAGGRRFEIVEPGGGDLGEDEPSFEGGVTRAAAQGLTFGFGDEIEAGAKYLAGGKYRDELDRSRRKISRFKEKHPYIAGGAELAGGLVVPIGAGANLARQGLTLGNVARGAATIGAPTGGLYALGEAENISSPEEAIAPVGKGILGGAAAYAVGAPILHGVARGGQAVYNAVGDAFNPRGAAARKVAQSFQDANLALPDVRAAVAPAVSNQLRARGLTDRDLDDILQRAGAGETHQSIAQRYGIRSPRTIGRYVASQRDLNEIPSNLMDVAQDVAERQGRSGAARPVTDLGRSAVAIAREGEQATERLVQRQVDQGGRVSSQLRRAGGGRTGEEEFERLSGVIEGQANAAYQRAYRGNPSVDLTLPLAQLQANTLTRAGLIRDGLENAQALFRPNMTLRQYVDARQALDHLVEISRHNGRRTPLTRALTGFRRTLNGEVRTQHPTLGQADDLFSGARGGQELLQRGKDLVSRAGSEINEELADLPRMTAEQRQMLRLGFLQKMADNVEKKRLGNETVGQFRTRNAQRLIRRIVGGPAAERLISDIRREALTTKTLRDLYSGSRTAPLAEDMKALEENAGLAAAALTGNVKGVMASLGARLRRQIGARQAREVLDMLTQMDRNQLLRVLREIDAGGASLARQQGVTGFSGLGGGAVAAGQAGQAQIPAPR